jgi:prolipoprotein diacylglyceryltransferase
VSVHPAAIYEMIALLGILAILLRLRSRVGPAGALFSIYLILSGLVRFLVEVVRTNRPILLGMTEAQWTSLVLCAVAIAWFCLGRDRSGAPVRLFGSLRRRGSAALGAPAQNASASPHETHNR